MRERVLLVFFKEISICILSCGLWKIKLEIYQFFLDVILELHFSNNNLASDIDRKVLWKKTCLI